MTGGYVIVGKAKTCIWTPKSTVFQLLARDRIAAARSRSRRAMPTTTLAIASTSNKIVAAGHNPNTSTGVAGLFGPMVSTRNRNMAATGITVNGTNRTIRRHRRFRRRRSAHRRDRTTHRTAKAITTTVMTNSPRSYRWLPGRELAGSHLEQYLLSRYLL